MSGVSIANIAGVGLKGGGIWFIVSRFSLEDT